MPAKQERWVCFEGLRFFIHSQKGHFLLDEELDSSQPTKHLTHDDEEESSQPEIENQNRLGRTSYHTASSRSQPLWDHWFRVCKNGTLHYSPNLINITTLVVQIMEDP